MTTWHQGSHLTINAGASVSESVSKQSWQITIKSPEHTLLLFLPAQRLCVRTLLCSLLQRQPPRLLLDNTEKQKLL